MGLIGSDASDGRCCRSTPGHARRWPALLRTLGLVAPSAGRSVTPRPAADSVAGIPAGSVPTPSAASDATEEAVA